jgi:hypothetical protein
MFKNFNHKFVYKYPLIWNTKIVPFLLISLAIHILFFIVGYQNAIVASVQIHNYYIQESNATTINLFAILISVLVFIIWCVLYFRNNGFKAFYPKENNSLFKEWMLIVLFCTTTFSYTLSAIFGANVQTRSIMSQKVALERCETICKVSMFLQGSFKEDSFTNEKVNGKFVRIERDSFTFEEKNYALNSLMNKNIESFPFFDEKQDSLTRLELQRLLKANNKEAISKIFKVYFAVANEHQLKSNISAEKWMDLVYDYPEFTNYKVIGKFERELQDEYGYEQNGEYYSKASDGLVEYDTVSTTIKNVNGQTYIYSKYYVSHQSLSKFYNKVSAAWQNPLLDWTFIMIMLYLSFAFSLVVFSFKVTSARNWLIALIALGVIQIIFGIGTVFFSYNLTFPILFLIYFLLICIYFSIVYVQKRGKRLSGISLNQILWLLPIFLPVIYVIVMDLVKSYWGYRNRFEFQRSVVVEKFPKIDWFEEHSFLMLYLNLVIVIFIMFILSGVIKKWRGIPEE